MPTIHLNGLRHYFRLEGIPGKQPLLLVHPIGADQSLFDQVVPKFLADFQVLRADLRGHGGTDIPVHDVTVEDLSSDLLALTQAVGWTRFAACGVSLGGLAALHAAISAPQRLSRLILCSTSAVMAPPPGGWNQRAAAARQNGMSMLADGMAARMFSDEFKATGHPVIESLKAVFARTDVEGYARCLPVLRDTDLRPDLDKVRTPTMVMHGTADPLITVEKVRDLLDGIREAQAQTFACGHFPAVELPDAFAQALKAFAIQD